MTDFVFNWMPLVGLVAAMLVGVFALILGQRGGSKARKLRKSGVTGLAHVTKKTARTSTYRPDPSSSSRQKKTIIHYLSYAFEIDGKHYEGTAHAASDFWRSVEEGSELEIIYYPADPSINELTASAVNILRIGSGVQIAVGLFLSLGGLYILATFSLEAYRGPDPQQPGASWVERKGVVLWVRKPESPFMRIFAPDARRIYVEIGEMEPDKLYSGRETVIYPYQTRGAVLQPGMELRAFINPENEFFSILAIEGTPR